MKGSEAMRGTSPFEVAVALMAGCLDDLQLTIERVYLGRDVEDTGVGLVVLCKLGGQPPVVGASGQFHGLVVGRQFP